MKPLQRMRNQLRSLSRQASFCGPAFLAFRFERLNPRTEILAIVMESPAAEEISVHHARLVHIDAAADFEIELALRHRRHSPAFHAAGARRNFHAMTDAGDWEIL